MSIKKGTMLEKIPNNCKAQDSYKKDGCNIVCTGCTIVDHDNCASSSSSGCDAIAINKTEDVIYIIEIKTNFTSKEAGKAVEQLNECIEEYKNSNLSLRTVLLKRKKGGKKKKGRVEGYALQKLRRKVSPTPQVRNCGEDLSKI